MNAKQCNSTFLPARLNYYLGFFLLTTAIFAGPQLAYAANQTLNGGETLSLNSDVTWDSLSTNTTANNWAIITGPYNITVTGKTDIQFVSFQNTGSINFEDETLIEHCVFDGNANVSIGTTSTPLSTNIIVEASDFRNQVYSTAFQVNSVPGDSIGTYHLKDNTFIYTTRKVILLKGRNGAHVQGNVLYNVELGNLSGSNWTIAGGHIYRDNFLSSDSGVTNYRTLAVNGGKPTITFDNNYCYYDFNNPHPFTFTSSGVAGTDKYINNIIEVVFNTDGANIFNSNTARPVEVSRNILIGSGSLVNAVGGDARQSITINNNTCYSKLAGNGNDGLLFLSESGPSSGTIDIYNNIISGDTDPGKGIASITGIQTISYSDYNTFYNVTAPYSKVSPQSGLNHDISDNPQFIAPSRNLSAWDTYKGGAGTKTSAIKGLAKMNGYNAASKLQNDLPSGYKPIDLMNWVRYGFTPTNPFLQGAGKDGTDIGAVKLATESNLSITIDKPLISD